MNEGDGKMMFIPDRVEIKRGEQIKFVLRNNGELDHEFILASTAENVKHAEEMKKNPEMEHDDPNGKRLAPKKTSEIVWRFTKAGPVRIWLPHSRSSRSGHDRNRHREVIVAIRSRRRSDNAKDDDCRRCRDGLTLLPPVASANR